MITCPHGCGQQWSGASNRRASQPLDTDATAAANQSAWSHCTRLTNSDGTHRQLTMSDDDACCRRFWMDAYQDALAKKKGTQQAQKSSANLNDPVIHCAKSYLAVEVAEVNGRPIEGATVSCESLGSLETDKGGRVDYGEVPPGSYTVTVGKSGYQELFTQAATTQATEDVAAGETKVIRVLLDPLTIILRENLIFIGSEQFDKTFWTKMMFMACGFVVGNTNTQIRAADKTTIIFVDQGYTDDERAVLHALKAKGCNILPVTETASIRSHINSRPTTTLLNKPCQTLLQDVLFFCHGKPSILLLNFHIIGDGEDVNIEASEIAAMRSDAFVPDGRIFSYACRTGNASQADSFNSDDEAHPEKSLAQQMADRFNVEVHAFLTRTDFEFGLRIKSDSKRISDTLKLARETQDGKVIEIPPEHEAFPHSFLQFLSRAAAKEGTRGYALWRKEGAMAMPVAGSTPTGLSTTMRVFTPPS
jgi:hypothetical protein